MMSTLNYRGYLGSIEPSVEDECLHGRIQFINDIITYEGESIAELKAAFEAAVNRYLQHCAKTGKQPNKPCSGTFNVRLGEELHRKAAMAAMQHGTTLNEFVAQAVAAAVEPIKAQHVVHEHVLVVDDVLHVGQVVSTTAAQKWSHHVLATTSAAAH
jgi:predicted HicB family RNase H-like nuclease